MILKDLLQGKTTNAHKKIIKSDVRRAKLLAVAFRKNGSMIANSTNRVVRGSTKRWTIHAEEFLIQKLKKLRARERFGPLTVLVMRWTPSVGWKLAKPCKTCRKLLEEYGINTILFTTNEGYSK